MRGPATIVALVVLVAASVAPGPVAGAPPEARQQAPTITHGVVVGDITSRSAVLWARGSESGSLHVRLSGGPHGHIAPVSLDADHDLTGQLLLGGLRPGTLYRYRAWVSNGPPGSAHGPVTRGSFRTAPAASDATPFRIAFGGDVSGQNVCRDADDGIPIAATIDRWNPDVFIGLGDMIYADDVCLATGRYGNAQVPRGVAQATNLAGFWAHWRYNREDPGLRALLASAGYVGVWDDHEVLNDFGPLSDTRATPPYDPTVHMMPIGRQAFEDYTPVARHPSDQHRLYRSLRYGRHLELFVLDTRQYRDANIAPDDPADPKTMLGAAQQAWLRSSLATSTATWKVVVSSVPMSIPTGFPAANGRDGWANFDQPTGFEHELTGVLRAAQSAGVDELVWVTTDVHFAEAFRYTPFADDPDFVVHEIATGPMNSGIFPNRAVDPSLNPETLAFYGPDTAESVTTWDQAKAWFNFGTLEVDADGTLTAAIVNTAGSAVFEISLEPD
jgi:alkaline phosphatase D